MTNNMRGEATIYDVAALAKVSITTVSRYINKPESVKKSTGDKIAEAIENLDYIPKGNTGSRGSREVRRIGVLTPFFPAPSFVDRLEGLIPILKKNNYEMVIYTVEDSNQLDEYLNSVPFTRRLDGLILMSVKLTKSQQQKLINSELKIIAVDTNDINFSRVLADDTRGGEIAAELFIKKNYFPCMFIGEKDLEKSYSLHPADQRLKGFKKKLTQENKTISKILLAETTVESGFNILNEYLENNKPPRAIFAMSDLQAIGAIKALKLRDIKIPEETAILGFDDISASDWVGLSTITQNLQNSGKLAGELLLNKIKSNDSTIEQINLDVNLVERSTC